MFYWTFRNEEITNIRTVQNGKHFGIVFDVLHNGKVVSEVGITMDSWYNKYENEFTKVELKYKY